MQRPRNLVAPLQRAEAAYTSWAEQELRLAQQGAAARGGGGGQTADNSPLLAPLIIAALVLSVLSLSLLAILIALGAE
jgi:hypothetical protein